MRAIKFKAKRLDNDEWMYGDLNHLVDGVYISNDHGCNIAQVDPTTVCQFTGFQDEGGNEIYEGDIVVSPVYPFCLYSQANDKFNPDYVGIVSWNEHLACFELRMRKNYSIPGRDVYSNKLRAFNKTWLLEYEVIGSIHDPEWQEKLNLKIE